MKAKEPKEQLILKHYVILIALFSFNQLHNTARGQCYRTQFDCGETHNLFVAVRCLNPELAVCDGRDDCYNNKDEEHCGDGGAGDCGDYEFKCVSGNIVCINNALVCNGIDNCVDGSDEQFCGRRTPPGDDADRCAIPSYGCTTYEDYYNDDTYYYKKETKRGNLETVGPHEKDFQKPSKRSTNPKNDFCDNDYDCINGDDEESCGIGACSSSMFSCNNGYCLDPDLVCDDIDDCGDGSDEGGLCSCNTVPVIIIGSVVGVIVFVILVITACVILCVLKEAIWECFKGCFEKIVEFFTCDCDCNISCDRFKRTRRLSLPHYSEEPTSVQLSAVKTKTSSTAVVEEEPEKSGPPFPEPQVSGPPFPEPSEVDPPPYTGAVGFSVD